MPITESNFLMIGTGTADESATPAAVNDNSSITGSTVDLLGDDTSTGVVDLFAIVSFATVPPTQSPAYPLPSVTFQVDSQRRLNGGVPEYASRGGEMGSVLSQATTINELPLGRSPCSRYMSCKVTLARVGLAGSVVVLARVTRLS